MDQIQRVKIITRILNKTYPRISVPLKSRNTFTLLISVLLSAQCTDVNVNNVTKKIYRNNPRCKLKPCNTIIVILINESTVFTSK